MKKNQELIHNEKKLKLNKKNYIIIIVPIFLAICLIVAIAFFVFIYTTPSNKIKKYLINNEYTCNKKACIKENNNTIYNYNYLENYLLIENEEYRLTISQNYPILEIKNNEYICSYTTLNYEIFMKVDNNFLYDKHCEKYIPDINKSIDLYKEIINDSKIDVNKIKK